MTEKNKTDNIAIYILLNIIFLYRGYKGKRKEEMEEMNMKKRYERPMMACEEFTPNEYVATCVDGHCDITSSEIYHWNDKNGNNVYDAGEKGSLAWTWWLIPMPLVNTACDSSDVTKRVSGDVKDVVPVVCENATLVQADGTVVTGTIPGWVFRGQTPGGGTSTHVSSVKPTVSNAS